MKDNNKEMYELEPGHEDCHLCAFWEDEEECKNRIAQDGACIVATNTLPPLIGCIYRKEM